MAGDPFEQSLKRRKEISIIVHGRRTGRKISLPVWFALEDATLWLLPVDGRRTQWFRNVLADPTIVIVAGSRRRTVRGEPITGRARVRPVVKRFQTKYGRTDVTRYYARLDGAVKVAL